MNTIARSLVCLFFLLLLVKPAFAQLYYLHSLQQPEPAVDSLAVDFNRYYPTSAGEAAWPILITLKGAEISEKALEGSDLIEGRVYLDLQYSILKEHDSLQLTGFASSLRYRRSASYQTAARQAQQQAVKRSRDYFEAWLSENRHSHPALATRFSLRFQEVSPAQTSDTVFYHPDRSLQWSDFQASPQGSRFGASIFANFGYAGKDTLIDGHFQVLIRLKVYMLKKQSWVRPENLNAYSLQHEQRHFQLAWLAAQKFKEMVASDSLKPENYSGRLGYWYLQAYREMNRLQEAYDAETEHGTHKAAQSRWDTWIDAQLAAYAQEI